MSEKTYRIRPLVWRHEKGRFREKWEASTIEGSYNVARFRDDKGAPWRGWSWTFEGLERAPDCRTAEEGKAAAEAHWRETITRFLEEVTHE